MAWSTSAHGAHPLYITAMFKGECRLTVVSDLQVKADRGELKADKSTIEALQKESAKAAQQKK